MAIFYIDLRDGSGLIPDEEGAEFDHIEAALDEARASAHDLVKQHAHDRSAMRGARVEVRDARGNTVATVKVEDVLARSLHGNAFGGLNAINRPLHR